MDRITPTQRPDHLAIAGHQRWRDLFFLHWPIDASVLRPLIPKRLSIDTFDGTAYIGIVPFAMFGVAPSWLPRMFAFDFLETNLRTYVHLDGEGPGVYFFSLEAASWLAVQAARIGWSLPYHYAGMRADHTPPRKERGLRKQHPLVGHQFEYESIRYGHKRPRFAVSGTIGEALGPVAPGSLEFFLMERYLLYTEHRGKMLCGQVYHTPYPAHLATIHHIEEELIAAAGLPPTEGHPTLAHFSPGVDVEIFDLVAV